MVVRRKVGARAHKIREIRAGRGQEGICARSRGKRVYVGRRRASMHGIGGKARCTKANGCGMMCTTNAKRHIADESTDGIHAATGNDQSSEHVTHHKRMESQD